MIQPDNEKSWYAFKIFFGKGKPVKAYFVANEIEHIYDVKQEYWDKNKKKRLVKEVPIMPSLILFRTTRIEAEEMERIFLNKVMLYRGKNSENLKEPSKISEREVKIFNMWQLLVLKDLIFMMSIIRSLPKATSSELLKVL